MANAAGIPLVEDARAEACCMFNMTARFPKLDPDQYFDLDTFDTTLCQLAVE